MANSSIQSTRTTTAPAPTSAAPNWQDLLGAFTAFNQLQQGGQQQGQQAYATSTGQAGLAQALVPPTVRGPGQVHPFSSYLMGGR